MKKLLYISLLTLLFGCEKTIRPNLSTPEKIIVIDAWLNQKPERQEIKIIRSQPYFDNSGIVKIKGAVVQVKDLNTGTIYNFQEGESAYFWDPTGAPLGTVGHTYQLTVSVDGEKFEATATLGRVPPVDSILFTYNEKDLLIKQDYYKAEFAATDPPGAGDAYWIKGWKNNTYLGKPEELNMAFDAGFSAGQPVDGQLFNIPIRKSFLNPSEEIPGKKGEFSAPYLVGDSLTVEIHSVNGDAFDFLFNVSLQTTKLGGFAELFSMPMTNAPSNIKSTNKQSVVNVAGFFNVAAVSKKGVKLTQQLADKARQNAR
jgi:hypothetical protein